MPKLGMEPLRRRQLIEATIDCIHEMGFAATTLQAIGRRAGLSTGLVAHYFRDKNGLLEATLRHLASDLGRTLARRQGEACTPRERLLAVIGANLEPKQFDPRIAKVWLAFWGQAPHAPQLKRIQRIYERRLLSNLREGFGPLLPADQVQEASVAMAAVIDGLWLRAALSEEPANAAAAQDLARRFLDQQLAASRGDKAQGDKAQGNKAQGNKAGDNKVRGNKVRGNKERRYG